MITILRLPFQIIEHPELQKLLRLAQLAPGVLSFPYANTVKNRIQDTVRVSHENLLQKLPLGAKLSIALDCWTSPFQQAFMAITGYFIDKDWNYREILLGFEPIYGTHSGANLCTTLLGIFQRFEITDRVLSVTTDNTSNNQSLMTSVNNAVQNLELNSQFTIIRLPCIAYVIQLSLNKLLGQIKANPKNETVERMWSRNRSRGPPTPQEGKEIAYTLQKV